MFENVKKWLEKGILEKIIGLFILLIAIYGIIWGIAEPLINSDFAGQEAIKHWWKYQIVLSIIFTLIIYIWLLPIRVLQSFSTDPKDTHLNEGYSKMGEPKISVITDSYYGDVYFLQGDCDKDALDWKINPAANKAIDISFVYQPKNKFILYLKISVVSNNEKKEQSKWIALKTEISLPVSDKLDIEWEYPIEAKYENPGWLTSQVRFSEVFQETFGNRGWKFRKLEGIRIRGEVKIQNIILRGRIF